MGLDDIDFVALADGIIDELKDTGEAFWDKLQEDQVPILKQAAKDLAKASLLLVTDPDNADLHTETILAVKSTLSSETALAAMMAADRIKDAIQRTLKRLVGVGLALL